MRWLRRKRATANDAGAPAQSKGAASRRRRPSRRLLRSAYPALDRREREGCAPQPAPALPYIHIRCRRIYKQQILADRSREQLRVLRYKADFLAQQIKVDA